MTLWIRILLLLVVTIGMAAGVTEVSAGLLSRAVAKAAAKRAAVAGIAKGTVNTPPKAAGKVLRRDVIRDQRTKARALTRDRTVFRYTSKKEAQKEMRRGIAPGRHMTAKGGRGRPLSAPHAKRRYGLPKKPEVRETIHLWKGHPLRHNRALGGEPGVGELTSPKRVPPSAIEKLVPVP